MAAFTAVDPKINEIVGSFGNFVAGVVVLAAGVGSVDLSSKMTRVDGAIGTTSTASSTTLPVLTISGTTLSVAGGTTDVISYIAFGLTKR